MKKTIKAFTLVELIVVITILAILWTIAFISLQWYSKKARDSKRTSDMNNINTSLELHQVKRWYYPDPDLWGNVTYSWWIVWTQWNVWEQVTRQLKELRNIPLDPLTENQYTYSLLNTKKEYQIWAIFEWETVSQINLANTYAAWSQTYKARVTWNYNWVLAKVSTWSVTYVLAVPSIIASEVWDVLDIITNEQLVYNDFSNIPPSYKSVNWYSWTGWFDYNSTNTWAVIVYQWSIPDLKTDQNLKTLSDNLKLAYNSSTAIATEWIYKQLISLDATDMTEIKNIVGNIANNNLKAWVDIDDFSQCTDMQTPTNESYFSFDSWTNTITDYNPAWWTDVVIPCTIGWNKVIIIWVTAFNNNALTSVIIPNSVTSIWEAAFTINNLTSLTIPNIVNNIWADAFWGNALISITIPNSVINIWESAFEANALTSVAIWNSVTSIWNSAFADNVITSVTIPNSVISIWEAAFKTNALTSIILPNSITNIWKDTFAVNQLTSVTIPNSVISIWQWAFLNNKLISINIPNSVISIWDFTFYDNSLTSVTIPNTVTSI